MQAARNRTFSALLIIMLFSVFNLCAVESIAASISSSLSFINESSHATVHAGEHSHGSASHSHSHDGDNHENCCSNVLATQTASSAFLSKNYIAKPAVSLIILSVAPHGLLSRLSQRRETNFDSDSSPPTVYRIAHPSHAPPLYI